MNPLAIRIAADLKAFKANMQEMKLQLETNASAMKRMSSSFDGSKVIGDANAMVKAIHDIGGASKLTDSEMRRVNGTVTEALAKYKALGRDAPPELLALQKATQKVNTETEKMPSLMDKVNARGVAMGAAIGTFVGNIAWSAVNKLGAELGEFAQRGIQLNAVQSSFERLAVGTKQSSVEMLSSMKTASRGMVSEFDLMKAANKAMLLGLPVTSAEMGTLSKAAVTLGRAMGQDATKSVDDLITALGRSSPMILDNLGITVKVGEANEIYAAKLKKTVEQLTDAEKKTAFYEEAMRRANEKTKELGESTKTLGEMLQTAWVSVGNVVTQVVSDYNIGLGAALSTTENFGRFLQIGLTQSWSAAIKLFAEMERGKASISAAQSAMDKAFKDVLDSQIKAKLAHGESAVAIAKVHGVTVEYVKSLEKVGPASKKAAKEVKESWSGTFTNDLFNFGAAIQKQIDEGIIAGAGETLEELLARRWKMGKSFSGSFRAELFDFSAIIQKQIDEGLIAAPGETLEELLARRWGMAKSFSYSGPIFDFGEKAGVSFKDAFADAVSDIGNVIVRALEGGGDVILAVVGSLANRAGQYFSDKFAEQAKNAGTSQAMAGIAGGLVTGIIGVGMSIINDMLKPSYTALEQLSRQFGKSVVEVTAQLKAMGAAGVKAFNDIESHMNKGLAGMRGISKGFKDAQDMFGLLDQFQTKEELEKIAAQWKGVHEYMLASGKYTAAQLAEAWKRYEEAQKAAIGAIEPEDTRPVGARGFPTKAQLLQAVKEAEEAYRYVRDSGLYTADVIEQAWQQWQDAMIASGDETAKRMKDLQSEILSLQKAVEAETPEYDANGVRMYGVEELRNIERLAALEAEKAALNLAQIEKEKHATVEAAIQADLTATKEFEAAKLRAINLDGYLHKLFSKGYEIPITFRLPGGLPTGGGLPSNGSAFGNGAPLPSSRNSMATITIVNINEMDGEVVARKTVKHTARLLPGELDFRYGVRS